MHFGSRPLIRFIPREFIESAAEDSAANYSLLFNMAVNRSLQLRNEPTPADTFFCPNENCPEYSGTKRTKSTKSTKTILRHSEFSSFSFDLTFVPI